MTILIEFDGIKKLLIRNTEFDVNNANSNLVLSSEYYHKCWSINKHIKVVNWIRFVYNSKPEGKKVNKKNKNRAKRTEMCVWTCEKV